MNQNATYSHLKPGVKKNTQKKRETKSSNSQKPVVKPGTYQDGGIETATPAKLVEMLYSGALDFLSQAKKAIEDKELALANEKIIRVEDIIMELNISLDMDKGGEISKNLRALYNYLYKQLLNANLHKDDKILEEVSGYIKELRETWVEAMKKEGNLAEKLPDPNRNRINIAL